MRELPRGRNNPAMSTTVCVVRPPDFLRARADGRVDLEMGKQLLADVARAAEPMEGYEVLIDIRDVIGQLTPDEVHELAGSLIHFRSIFLHKTAVLSPRERFDNARFFSLLAASYGFRRIRAFLTYEDAMEWLLAPRED
jgi:hypothetical protein